MNKSLKPILSAVTDAVRSKTDPVEVMSDVSRVGSQMASDIVDIAGFLDEMGEQAQHQMSEMGNLKARGSDIVEANKAVQNAIAHVSEMNQSNLVALEQSLASFKSSADKSKEVAEWVKSVETRIAAVESTLKHVTKLNAEISSIARQVNILAINAKIEAVRAGQSGRGFAVVAEAINDLSRNTGKAAEAVNEGVQSLGVDFTVLREEAGSIQSVAADVLTETAQTNEQMDVMLQKMSSSANTSADMSNEAQRISDAIEIFEPVFETLTNSALQTAQGVEESRTRIHALVDDSETIVRLSILGGGATDDMTFITYVTDAAAKVSEEFASAISRGLISEAELFDQTYMPIPGSNPQQVMTRFTKFTDATLPQFQEPALMIDPRVVFCAAVDTQGYLPTHNTKFSQPQSADPVWNTANCRNRRIFNDRVGLKAGRSTEPFLMQVYRRDMGGGQFVLMKDLSAPIKVNGRHWGGLRLAYKI